MLVVVDAVYLAILEDNATRGTNLLRPQGSPVPLWEVGMRLICVVPVSAMHKRRMPPKRVKRDLDLSD